MSDNEWPRGEVFDNLPTDLTDSEAEILYKRAKPRPYTEAEIERMIAHTVGRAERAEPLSDLEACVEQFRWAPQAIHDQAQGARRELAKLRLERDSLEAHCVGLIGDVAVMENALKLAQQVVDAAFPFPLDKSVSRVDSPLIHALRLALKEVAP